MNCICPIDYLKKKPEEHTQKCYDSALDAFEKEIEVALASRVAWYTMKSTKNCTHPFMHKAHGGCRGYKIDRSADQGITQV